MRRLHSLTPVDNPIPAMRFLTDHRFILLGMLGILGTLSSSYIFRSHTTPIPTLILPHSRVSPSPSAKLSPLARAPDWKSLETYQKSITRENFENLLTSIFTTDTGWKKFIQITDSEASIQTGEPAPNDVFHLAFSSSPVPVTASSCEKSVAKLLPAASADRPLAGLRIAIDPGHIGGAWAKMEERWFVIGYGKPVCEGNMTLQVAKLLKILLEKLGAEVLMVRTTNEPVTSVRPESLLALAINGVNSNESLRKNAERLFYRTAEIHARAKYVNETLKPDLVLCLHFNAEAWGDPLHPTLTDHHHLHLIVNGAYSGSEISFADQRFELMKKLLQRTLPKEITISADIAESFKKSTDLPPFHYSQDSKNVRPIPDQPFIWARNLLANRLYDCPVIFMEPYVMNSITDYARIQAGDYDGLRHIAGKMRPSIFHEYANAVANGLKTYYSNARRLTELPDKVSGIIQLH
jgi:N-acetylmuramoyl-L-alanine amidase